MPRLPGRRSDASGSTGPAAPPARLVPGDGAPAGDVRLAGAELVVGRSEDAGLPSTHPSLSRRHARLFVRDGAWWVEDLGSANGTTVDGVPVTEAALAPGAVIGFAGAVFYRFVPDPVAATAAAAGRGSPWNRLLCLRLVPEEGGPAFVLRRRLTVVGRSPEADLRLAGGEISGVHARIVRRGDRIVLRDTGSRNGTAVNGRTVSEAELAPGDRVAFGGAAFRVARSPVPTGRALAGASAGLLLAAAAVVAAVLLGDHGPEPLWTRKMYLDQVDTSLVAALRALDDPEPAFAVASAQIDIARRSLVAADLLRPDRQTQDELAEALARTARDPAVARALHGRDVRTVLARIEQGPDTAPPPPPSARQAFDLRAELSRIVAEFGIDTRDTPIPDGLVDEVDRFTRFWTGEKRGFTVRARARGEPLLEKLRAHMRDHRLPQVFCYLPFIESAYQTTITSGVGARGLWQLMPGTARDYGLRVDDQVDERTDPDLATEAACKHLEYLLHIFGPDSFMCAVAAYNKGHNGMRRCLARSGQLQATWRYWNLSVDNDGCLPRETIEYVPRFLAAVVVLRNPGHFGLDGPD